MNPLVNVGGIRDAVSTPELEDSLEEGMTTHSSILAWRVPWTEEPGGLQSIGLQKIGHDWSDLACTHIHTNAHTVTSFDYTSSASPCHLYFRVKFLKDVSILTVSKPPLVFPQPTCIRLFVLPTLSNLLLSGEAAESTRTHQSSTLRLTWSSLQHLNHLIIPSSLTISLHLGSRTSDSLDFFLPWYWLFSLPCNAFSSSSNLIKLGHHHSSVIAPFLFSVQIHFLGDFI